MLPKEIKPGHTYKTDGGLECKVVAIAGQKVVLRTKLDSGKIIPGETSLGRFAAMVTKELENPEASD